MSTMTLQNHQPNFLDHDGMFGDRLVDRRNDLSYTQEDIAKLAEVNVRTIRNWEHGGRPRTGRKLRSVAEVLDVSVSWLLWGEEGR